MWADHLTGIADITATEAKNGEPRVNIGEMTDGSGVGAAVAMWCPEGFYGLPNAPGPDGACQALFLYDGESRRIVGARDGRYHSKAGSPKAGDRWIVSNCDARILLKKEDNAVTVYTANEDGDSQMIDLRGSNSTTLILNGGCVIRQKKDELLVAIGSDASFLMDADGFQFMGKKFVVLCNTVSLGLKPGGAVPVPGLDSALKGPVGIAGSPSPSVTIA